MDKYNRLKLNYKRFALAVKMTMSEDPNSKDPIANTSKINIKITATTSGSSYNTGGTAYFKGSVECNGQKLTINKSTFNISTNSTKTLYSTTWTVTHNSDGSCPSASGNVYVYLTSNTDKSATANCNMSTIARYFSSVNLWVNGYDENSVNFGWSTSERCSWVRWHMDNSPNWTDVGDPDSSSGSFIVPNWGAGSYHDIFIEARRADSGLWSNSSRVPCTTFYYPHVQSDPNNFTIGEGASLNLYNPLGRHVRLAIVNNDTGEDIGTYDGSGYQGYVNGEFKTAEAIDAQYKNIPNSQSALYFARCYCYDTGTTYERRYGTYYVNASNSVPTFSNFDYEDTNVDTIALTGDNKKLIKGYSKVKAIISSSDKANPRNYASMRTYRLTNGNSSVDASYSSSETVETNPLTVTTKDILVSAIDSRGLSTTVTKESQFVDYFKPSIKSVVGERSDGGVGENVTLNINGIWWEDNFGNKDNELKDIKYYYKKTNESEYHEGQTTLAYTSSEGTFRVSVEILGDGWDASSSYNIKVIATDLLGTSDEYVTTMSSGSPGIAIYKNCVAIGAKYDERIGGVFQVKGQAGAYYPMGSVILTDTGLDPNDYLSGTWTKHGNIKPQGTDLTLSVWQRSM